MNRHVSTQQIVLLPAFLPGEECGPHSLIYFNGYLACMLSLGACSQATPPDGTLEHCRWLRQRYVAASLAQGLLFPGRIVRFVGRDVGPPVFVPFRTGFGIMTPSVWQTLSQRWTVRCGGDPTECRCNALRT